jgi:hypothetical protein
MKVLGHIIDQFKETPLIKHVPSPELLTFHTLKDNFVRAEEMASWLKGPSHRKVQKKMLINVSSRIDERLKSFQPASEASRGHQGRSGLGEGLVH